MEWLNLIGFDAFFAGMAFLAAEAFLASDVVSVSRVCGGKRLLVPFGESIMSVIETVAFVVFLLDRNESDEEYADEGDDHGGHQGWTVLKVVVIQSVVHAQDPDETSDPEDCVEEVLATVEAAYTELLHCLKEADD